MIHDDTHLFIQVVARCADIKLRWTGSVINDLLGLGGRLLTLAELWASGEARTCKEQRAGHLAHVMGVAAGILYSYILLPGESCLRWLTFLLSTLYRY